MADHDEHDVTEPPRSDLQKASSPKSLDGKSSPVTLQIDSQAPAEDKKAVIPSSVVSAMGAVVVSATAAVTSSKAPVAAAVAAATGGGSTSPPAPTKSLASPEKRSAPSPTTTSKAPSKRPAAIKASKASGGEKKGVPKKVEAKETKTDPVNSRMCPNCKYEAALPSRFCPNCGRNKAKHQTELMHCRKCLFVATEPGAACPACQCVYGADGGRPPMKMLGLCYQHPESGASKICDSCEQLICKQCQVRVGDGTICQECKARSDTCGYLCCLCSCMASLCTRVAGTGHFRVEEPVTPTSQKRDHF